ncbi:TolC family protein [Chryseolinea lacunae]|uniref:TolC family protein n=1 Tax=Chryseolinea lacunae TaxID=2801331 RepID=A0ABS1L614_9BACT|nr:TolC family protein [Chryseolinea lacunae]MBL0745971.1 TolC family protein [Chryseolinea lacunae]
MNKVVLGTLVWSILCALSVQGQVAPLSLDQALEATLKNNKEIHLATLDEAAAEAKYGQTNAVFLPQIKLSYTGMSSNNPLNAFGFKLQQQAITQNDFNPYLLNEPSATQNFVTKAEWLQPILNLDMWAMRQAAQEQQLAYAFKTKRTKEYVSFEVQRAYAQLQLAHQAKSVLKDAFQAINAIYTATTNRFEKGYLQKSDVLQVEVQVKSAENKLAEAISNIQNASDYLGLLMGAKAGVIYQVDSIARITPIDNTPAEIPIDRADFRAMQSAVTTHEKMIKSGKMAYLPKLNAFGEYMINDREAFGFGSNSYLVGAQLSWTLFNGTTTRNKISEQRIERDKTVEQLALQKEQAQLELNKAARQLQDALFAIQRQEIAVSQSAEALRIVQNRFQQGLVTTNDVLQSQSLFAQQKLLFVQAIYQYNTTASYRLFLTTTSVK